MCILLGCCGVWTNVYKKRCMPRTSRYYYNVLCRGLAHSLKVFSVAHGRSYKTLSN